MANEEKFDNVSSFPTLSSSLPGLFVSSLTLAHPVYTFFSFLFRTSDGKLHLLPEIGKIPFVDAALIEDPTETNSCDDDDGTNDNFLLTKH